MLYRWSLCEARKHLKEYKRFITYSEQWAAGVCVCVCVRLQTHTSTQTISAHRGHCCRLLNACVLRRDGEIYRVMVILIQGRCWTSGLRVDTRPRNPGNRQSLREQMKHVVVASNYPVRVLPWIIRYKVTHTHTHTRLVTCWIFLASHSHLCFHSPLLLLRLPLPASFWHVDTFSSSSSFLWPAPYFFSPPPSSLTFPPLIPRSSIPLFLLSGSVWVLARAQRVF